MSPVSRLVAAASATATLAAALSLVTAIPSDAGAPHHDSGSIKRVAPGGVSATDSEFTQTCPTLPATQGEDAWVFALPANVAVAGARVAITGTPATHAVHAYAYAANCSFTRTITGAAGGLAADLAAGETFLSVYTTTASLVTLNVALTVTPPDTQTPPPTPTASPSPSSPPPATRGTYPVTPNDPLFVQNGADDPFLSGQWGMRTIHAPQAWQEARATGAGINVAVLDTGMDVTHEDFACPGKVRVVGDAPADDDGHGTHVAGIVGACTNNGTGVVGVAPDSTIMPFKVLDPAVTDTVGTLATAIDDAVANGAHVINMSLGFGLTGHVGTVAYLTDTTYAPIEQAIARAVAAGVVVVAAAGNDTSPLCGFPAIAEDVICVGSSDRRDVNSWFGNFPVKDDVADDPDPALLAPGGGGGAIVACDFSGEDVLSTYSVPADRAQNDCDGIEGYATIQGTSMAAPHVAGVAALVYDRIGGTRSGANGAHVVEALLGSAVDLYGPGYDPASGYGRVDALAAVRYFDAAPEPTPTPTARPTAVSVNAPATGQFSDSVAVAATLTGDGTPLANESLTFQLLGRDGFREVSATTDSTGVARATLTLDAPPGAYDLSVGYAGKQDTWHASAASTPFTIDREDTTTTLAVSGSGSKRTLTATVADADSARGVAGVVVEFFADGTKVGEAVTDADGVATRKPPSGARGSSTAYTARFGGNAFYRAS